MCFLIAHCWGGGGAKSCSAASCHEGKGKPTSLPLFAICPSQWAQAGDGLEGKMNGGYKWPLDKERTGERVRERCMAAHIASDTMTDEGIMEHGLFPQ